MYTFHDRASILLPPLPCAPPQRTENRRRQQVASSAAALKARQLGATPAVRSSADRKDSTRSSSSLGRCVMSASGLAACPPASKLVHDRLLCGLSSSCRYHTAQTIIAMWQLQHAQWPANND